MTKLNTGEKVEDRVEVSLRMSEFYSLVAKDLMMQYDFGLFSDDEKDALLKVIKLYATKEELGRWYKENY